MDRGGPGKKQEGRSPSSTELNRLLSVNRGVQSPGKRILPIGMCDNDVQIERWQASARVEADEDDAGLIARLIRACIDSLAYLVRVFDQPSTSKRSKTTLRRCESLLKLWANGHEVWSGKLDNMLERSKSLRDTTLSILNPLCKVLSNSEFYENSLLGGLLILLQALNDVYPTQRTPTLFAYRVTLLNFTARQSG